MIAEAVDPRDPFVIGIRREDGWHAVESQADMQKAMRARNTLAKHSLRINDIEKDADVRIFLKQNVTY